MNYIEIIKIVLLFFIFLTINNVDRNLVQIWEEYLKYKNNKNI